MASDAVPEPVPAPNTEEPYHATIILEVDFPSSARPLTVREAIESAAGLAAAGMLYIRGHAGGVELDDGTWVRFRVEP